MNIISIAVVAIVFIALCVVVYRAAKHWHWVNVLFLMLTFISGLAATIGLAQVGHLTNKQKRAAEDAEQRATKLIAEAEEKVSGSFDSFSYDSNSLRGISQELSITMTGRGRVWSRGTVTSSEDGVSFQFPKPRPEGDENSVNLTNVVLYAFSEGMVPLPKNEDADDAGPPPVVAMNYIGSVRVVEDTPAALNLEPRFISNPEEYAEPTATWSLFEKMPLDRHDTVRDAFRLRFGLAEGDEIDLGKLREFLRQGLLTAERVEMDPASEQYERLLDRYTFDGLPLGAIQTFIDSQPNRISRTFDPAPEEVVVRYKFNAKSNKSYQVDMDGSLDTDGPFTASGLAIEPALHLGKEVEFEEGDIVKVDLVSATGYTRSEGTQVAPFPSTENVTEIERLFVRQLRDYPYILATITQKSAEFEEEIARRQKSNEVQTATVEDTKKQSAERSKLAAMLEADKEKLEVDRDNVTRVLSDKNAQVEDLREKVNSYRQQNQAASY